MLRHYSEAPGAVAVSPDLEAEVGAAPTRHPLGSRMASSAVLARALLGAMGLGVILILWRVALLRPESLQAGDQFVPPQLVNLDGKAVLLDVRENLLLIVIRANCPACREELSDLAANLKKTAGWQVRIISLSTLAATLDIAGKEPIRSWTLVDAEGALESRYGRFRVPTALLVSHAGQVLAKTRGKVSVWKLAALAATAVEKAQPR